MREGFSRPVLVIAASTMAALTVAACAEPPVNDVEAGADAPTVARAPDPRADRAAIEEILRGLPQAWNARDAAAWVAHFAAESDFTNILGMHFPDRAANEARHAQLFGTIFGASTLTAEVLDVEFVGDDAAVTELEFRLVGYERLPPGITETAPGELRTRLISVFERRGAGWEIVAAQNTAILPAAVATPG